MGVDHGRAAVGVNVIEGARQGRDTEIDMYV